MSALSRVAAFKYKASATQEEKAAAIQGLLDLYALKSAYISDVKVGKNNNQEGFSHDYDVVFTTTFKSIAHRDEFIPDPDHVKYKASILPIVEGVLVFDFVNGIY
ncbi:hypothetical protein NEOLEDRAFT_1128862 [Neolentinus lepideus HHB14362 ss-1]|uniref:Stress-response A/B barrel domain-containing protein n=1 Tax=Neolentinus lepideus HHB14362 ss-1 TaxID=1314782 RepID=A0A165UTT0_9AGAM|nr:hypothetical protein NEOLEDRAFT_1128862 [Neolentinus lepideus HHB14362 ss-1]